MLAAAGSALVLVLTTITVLTASTAGAADPISYTFRFENGVTLSGTATDKTFLLTDAGGTSVDNPTGMEVHLSCSDKFVGGWGQKDGPTQGVDTAWRIDSYFIQKGSKTCGTPTPPPPPANPPSIDVEKFVNGQDADDPTGPEIPIGETATFTYEVTNTGGYPLRDVEVTDSELGTIACPRSDLGIDESMSCAEQTEIVTEAGSFTMKATATGVADVLTPGLPQPVPEKAKHAARFTFVNGTTVIRVAEKKDDFFPEVGGSSVENPTGVKMHLSCSDEFVGGWGQKDGPTQGVDTAWQIESYSIGKVKDGEFELKCGDPFVVSSEQEVMDMDPVFFVVPEPSEPAIDIEKFVNGDDADTPPGPTIDAGSTAVFTYVVQNTGDVVVTDIAVTDNVMGVISCPRSVLQPGQWMLCTPTFMEVSSDDPFMESCVAGIGAEQAVTDCDPVYYRVPPPVDDPKVKIEKFVNGDDANNPPGPTLDVGSTATFTYVVSNIGEEPLEDVTVADNVAGAIACPRSALGVGESMDCSSTTMVVESGQQFMKACVGAVGVGSGRSVDDCDPVYYLGKGSSTGAVGDEVTFLGSTPAPSVQADLFIADEDGNRKRYLSSTTTDEHGLYAFTGLPAGCYAVVFIAPPGFEFTNGSRYAERPTCLDAGEVDNTLDAKLRASKH